MVFRFKEQNSAAAWQAHGPLTVPCRTLTSIHWFHQFWTINQWRRHNIRVKRHQKGGLHLKLVFLFVRSGENFPWTCTMSLDASSAAGSSIVVRCAGIDGTNQRSLVCCRSQKKQTFLKRWTNRQRWTTWTGKTPEAQADPFFPVVWLSGKISQQRHYFLAWRRKFCRWAA